MKNNEEKTDLKQSDSSINLNNINLTNNTNTNANINDINIEKDKNELLLNITPKITEKINQRDNLLNIVFQDFFQFSNHIPNPIFLKSYI